MANIKEEINMSFSDHDYVPTELDLDSDAQLNIVDVETISEEQIISSEHVTRRTIKKPQTFTMENQMNKRKVTKSGTISKKRENSKKNVVQYEVDYIFGKRADKMLKGKVEYRVFWKGYAINDATWEPEDNLRHCTEAIDKYERSQGLQSNNKSSSSKKEKENEKENVKDVIEKEEENNQENMPNNNNIVSNNKTKKKGRPNGRKRRSNSTGHQTKKGSSKKSRMPLATLRARSSSISKTAKLERDILSNDAKATNSFSSKDTSSIRSTSQSTSFVNKNVSVDIERKNSSNSEANIVEFKVKPNTKREDIQNIILIRPCGIEGVDAIVADVLTTDDVHKTIGINILKKIAPDMVMEYYEQYWVEHYDKNENKNIQG